MNLFLLIILISFIEFFGDSSFKVYARTKNNDYLISGIFWYSLMVYLLITALKFGNVAYVNGMWDSVSCLIETVLAIWLLHETLSNRIQYLGIVLIIAGIFALHYGPIPK